MGSNKKVIWTRVVYVTFVDKTDTIAGESPGDVPGVPEPLFRVINIANDANWEQNPKENRGKSRFEMRIEVPQ